MKLVKKSTNRFEINKLGRLAKEFGLDPNVIKLLNSRGYRTRESIDAFLHPNVKNFYDPYLLKDMKRVVERINKAVADRESIVILGDYDTDGISATSILYKHLSKLGNKPNVFLPNRIADGYGLSFETIDKIIELYNPSLIITVDCGISAYQEIEYAMGRGVDIIVTDHHDIPDQLPRCPIINPKMPNQAYPFKELCGAGVALKVVQALSDIKESLQYVTIAAIATVADIVPLVDENRLITYYGLKNQRDNMPLGLQRLIKNLKLIMPLSSTDVSFKLAPKINATGRMGDPMVAFKLYVSEDSKTIANNIQALLELNEKRVLETNNIVEDAMRMLEDVNTAEKGIIVVENDNWESGVLGIICSRLVDIYNKPACVLAMVDGELKGSLRSVPNVNIYDALAHIKQDLVQFGGHNQAAGVTIEPKNYHKFVKDINNYILRTYSREDFLIEKKYDMDLSKIKLTDKFVRDLDALEPFGLNNEKPLFKLTFNNATVSLMPQYPNHIKAKINDIDFVGFNLGQYIYNFCTNSNKTIIFELSLNKYGGTSRIKGLIKHITFAKLNTTVKTEIVSGMYLNQLQYINCSEPVDNKPMLLEQSQLHQLIDKLTSQSKFGTLVVSNGIVGYQQLIGEVDSISNFELYNINNKTGINTLLFSPSSNVKYNNFDNIILLDAPIHIGYVNYLCGLGKKVYVCNTKFDMSNLKQLDVSRSIFGKYHNMIKNYIAKNPNATMDTLTLFNAVKRANPHFTNIKFNQFNLVLLVLQELGIVKYSNGTLIFTDVVSNLKNSKIYNFISLLLDIS